MSPQPFNVPTLIGLYHITSITNLPGILADGGVTCFAKQPARGIQHTSIAHSSIQDRRARTRVNCGPGGVLHDYVPMFFCRLPPMLYAIKMGKVDGRVQHEVIYLCVRFDNINGAALPFVFTDGQGIMATTQFFDDAARFDQVDWPLMTQKMWNDTASDPDRPRRRQAEFLVHDFLPWDLVQAVAVPDAAREQEVLSLMNAQGGECVRPVLVRDQWYYK